MKNILNKILILFLVVSLVSCSEDYLETTPTDAISTEGAFDTEAGAEAALQGIYRNLRSFGSGGTTRHEDFGFKSTDVIWDLMGQDVQMTSFNWFIFDYQLDYWAANFAKTNIHWTLYYETINNVNNILAGIEGNQETWVTDIAAQARALRAYSYFRLARLYQHTYLKDPDAPGVPIYTTPASPETEGNPRASLREVYELIVSDLEFAVENLEDVGNNDGSVNKDVAEGIYARVALEMGDWEKASTYAEAARSNIEVMQREDYLRGFTSNTNPGWIWGLPQYDDQKNIYADFFSHFTPPSFFDVEDDPDTEVNEDSLNYTYRPGYNSVGLNSAFVKLFEEGDVRKETILVNPDPSVEETDPNKYYMIKFRDTENLAGHYVAMRAAEMVLIQAEAEARLGNLQKAQDLLDELRRERIAGYEAEAPAGSVDAMVDRIWIERRKELFGEGFGLADIKRLQKPMKSEGNHFYRPSEKKDLPANSKYFIFQLPQDELDANINIADADQNVF